MIVVRAELRPACGRMSLSRDRHVARASSRRPEGPTAAPARRGRSCCRYLGQLCYAQSFLYGIFSHYRAVLMDGALLKRPSALIPIAMSVAALATVIGYAAMFGIARQADEGTAAYVWQFLMAGQVPVVAFFAIKW